MTRQSETSRGNTSSVQQKRERSSGIDGNGSYSASESTSNTMSAAPSTKSTSPSIHATNDTTSISSENYECKAYRDEGIEVVNVGNGLGIGSKKEERGKEKGKGKETKSKGLDRNKSYSKKDTMLVMFTFINCCVGSGLLAIGKIFSTAGFVMASIYMVASVAYCVWSFRVLSSSSYHGNFGSIKESGENLWGKKYGLFVDVCLICATMGFFCSYVSVSSDYIRDGIYRLAHVEALGSDTWKIWFKPIVSAVIVFPLTLVRTIDVISLVSSFAIIFALVAFIGINVRFFQFITTGLVNGKPHPRPPVPVLPAPGSATGPGGWPATIAYFTTFFALFTIQPNMIPLQRELDGSPTQRKRAVDRAAGLTMIICTFIYVVTGIEGALMFNRSCTPEEVAGGCIQINANILLTFGEDMAMIIIKLLYAIVVLVTFPCMIYPVRSSICGWFKIDKFNGKLTHPEMTRAQRRRLPLNVRLGYFWFVLIGLIVVILVTIIAIVIPDIDKVLSITANIFGLVIYEIHEVFIWFKLPLCKANSVGKLIDEKLVLGLDIADGGSGGSGGNGQGAEGVDVEKEMLGEGGHRPSAPNSNGLGAPVVGSVGARPGSIFHTSMRQSRGFGKISEAYRTSMRSITDARKYSLVLQTSIATKHELAKAFGRKSGERTWEDEDTVSCSSEDFPYLDHGHTHTHPHTHNHGNDNDSGSEQGSSTSSSSGSSSDPQAAEKSTGPEDPAGQSKVGEGGEGAGSTHSVSSTERTEKRPGRSRKESIRASFRKLSALQARAKSVVEGCPQGAIEVVFPNVSCEEYKRRGCRFAVFIVFNVFFIGFSVGATACDIYGWVVK